MRPITENTWKSLTYDEKFCLTKYTRTYSYLNEPLRGLTYYGKRADNEYDHDMPIVTNALSKQRTEKVIVVRRGTDDFLTTNGKMLSELKAGDTFIDGGFLSTGVRHDKGLFYEYKLVIVVPKGAQGIYAEPFSHYTDYHIYDDEKGNLWNGKDKQVMRNEREWIGQRGSKFKVISITGKTINLIMIGQLYSVV